MPVDEVEYHYEVIEDKDSQLKTCLDTQVDFLSKLLKQSLVVKEGGFDGREVIIEEEQEVGFGFKNVASAFVY